VEPRAAEDAAFVRFEDCVHKVLAEVEVPSKTTEQIDFRGHRLRFFLRPRKPRAQVFEAVVNGLLEERRVARLPAADYESFSRYPVRRPRRFIHRWQA
jgi:hypothetical protein